MLYERVGNTTVVNNLGLHARAAALFVKTAEKYESEVTVTNKNNEVSGKSIMSLIMLTAGKGTNLTIKTKGKDAIECYEDLVKLIANKFGEEV